jgi:L-amino acid N-acyltransferase YncA
MKNPVNKKIICVPLTEAHWPDVNLIYKQGIASGNATFETTSPDWTVWNQAHRADCRFVAIMDERIVGWAALSPVSGRCVYAGVAEISVYVHEKHRGFGIGSFLLETVVRESEENGIWTLQTGIFPENIASIRIHEKNGFRTVGIRERLGKMNNKWRDVILLERRSLKAGT